MATKHDVIRLHQLRPEWSAPEIAAEIGCHSAYVRSTAQRNGLVLPSNDKNRTNHRYTQEKTMTMNGNSSLTDAFAARKRELEAEMAALDKALAILTGIKAEPPATGTAPLAPRRRRKKGTYRDWIFRTARRPGVVTPDAVVAAAAERGRVLNRKALTVELSKMRVAGLLAKVPGGYQAAQAQ
jgi:hypothetical protein